VRDRGEKSLAVYLTGGVPSAHGFVDHARAVADAGADVIEVGIPWSDPVIDGPVVQRASQVALSMGVTPAQVLDLAAEAELPVPVVVMTYANPVFRLGLERFSGALSARDLAGAIVPDLPIEESGAWEEAAAAAGVASVLLAPPSASERRLEEICRRSTGFVYGMSLMGVTGVRQGLSDAAARIGSRLRMLTEKPVLLGIGISTPDQAALASEHCDGVVVGSAVVGRILDGATPTELGLFVGQLKARLS